MSIILVGGFRCAIILNEIRANLCRHERASNKQRNRPAASWAVSQPLGTRGANCARKKADVNYQYCLASYTFSMTQWFGRAFGVSNTDTDFQTKPGAIEARKRPFASIRVPLVPFAARSLAAPCQCLVSAQASDRRVEMAPIGLASKTSVPLAS